MTTTEHFERILEGAMKYAPAGTTREEMAAMLERMEATPATAGPAPVVRTVPCPHCRHRTTATVEVEPGTGRRGRTGWVVCEECTETFVIPVALRAEEVE
jgi:hypothetical protein